MSLFGKILAGLNIVVALAFVCLAAMDYGKQRTWTHAALRYELATDGIPVDEEEQDRFGNKRVDLIGPETLKQIFQQVGEPVPTQMKEVERVREVMQRRVSDDAVPGSQGQKLARILMPLAATAAEREELHTRIQDANANKPTDEELQQRLNQAFASVLDMKMSPAERRNAIARLLVPLSTLDPDLQTPANRHPLETPEYRRLQVVLGTAEVGREVSAQASRLGQIDQDVANQIIRDRGTFAVQYMDQLSDIRVLAKEVAERQNYLATQQELTTKHQVVVNNRKKDRDDLNERLNMARSATDTAMQQQAERELSLFRAQQRLRDTYRKNMQLEQTIRDLETKTTSAGDR